MMTCPGNEQEGQKRRPRLLWPKKNFFPDINLSLRCEVSDEFQISILNYIIANCEYHGNTCFHIKIFVILVRL